MITIYASIDRHADLLSLIQREDRLEELIHFEDLSGNAPAPGGMDLIVDEDCIRLPLDWGQSRPPFLLSDALSFEPMLLLGLIFHLLGNDPKAWEYLRGLSAYEQVERQNQLKYGLPISLLDEKATDYIALHNHAVSLHYGLHENQPLMRNPLPFYAEAMELAPDGDHRAFTARELATLLLDQGDFAQAESVLEKGIAGAISETAIKSLELTEIKLEMSRLRAPIDPQKLEKLKQKLWSCMKWCEAREESLRVAMLLQDACHVANVSESYAEALGYIQRAITIFDEEGLVEMSAGAMVQKGILLGTWAQNDNPQFYRPAIESYQKALYTFTREQSPQTFADIHHKLGVLYAEMPDEHKKRGIWAGVASASFQAALDFYTKEKYPYEYASICNNFANAFTRFPMAIHSDNFVKAMHYYEEALSIRTADWPYERAISLLNYLSAAWNAGNDPDSFHEARIDDMVGKAEEVFSLVKDKEMHEEALRHIENLNRLREVIAKETADA